MYIKKNILEHVLYDFYLNVLDEDPNMGLGG